MPFMKKKIRIKIKEEEKQTKIVSMDFRSCASSEEFVEKTIHAIQECSGMKTLHLEGKGVDIAAAKAIGNALESQSSLEKVIWTNIFKTVDEKEMIFVLTYMAKGIIKANAKLVTFKLNDSPLGSPVIVGLQELFESPCCLTLQELSLSNNYLKDIGAQQLSQYLDKCHGNGLMVGTPMQLTVFECSNNELGNRGAFFVSEFLKKLGSLESIDLTRNCIGYGGVVELSTAIYSNPLLVKIILDDNKLSTYGVIHLTRCLQSLQKLQTLSLRQCFLTAGDVRLLAASLENSCPDVRRIDLSFNEIKAGFHVLLDVMEKKTYFENLIINFNPLHRAIEDSLHYRILNLKEKKVITKRR